MAKRIRHMGMTLTKQEHDPLAVGGGFLACCFKQGWLRQRSEQYFATDIGARELRDRFDIKV